MVLALALAFSFSTVAFAAEESGIPENATRHTIEVTVEPGENDIAPYIWGQGTYNPPVNGATYTASFTTPHRYMAYEIRGIKSDGSVTNSTYEVSLLYSLTMTSIASITESADGNTYKMDWITVEANDNYLFKIQNYTGTSIKVTITYYTWA